MKNLTLSFVATLLTSVILSQTSLTFEKHALKSGFDNPMTYCAYTEAGDSGSNIFWDFADLKALEEFTGKLNDVSDGDFTYVNTVLEEFGVKFYFNVSEHGIEQHGYVSADGRTSISYSNPFEKVRFPFNYQDSYTSPFSGEYYTDNEITGQIDGSAFVTADSWGTLLLPGKTEFKNTIRLKSVKTYKLELESSENDVKMITYRWYNSTHRYPLLVLTEITTSVNGKAMKTRTQAAYNSNAVKAEALDLKQTALSNIEVYPNPSQGDVFISLNSTIEATVDISITDMSGKEMFKEINNISSGDNVISLSGKLHHLDEGLYLITINVGNRVEVIELSLKR